jgi:hypothetical protein
VHTFPKSLLRALRQKECVLFIGSGVSAWSGLPSWQQLLQQMLQFLEEHGLPRGEGEEIQSVINSGDLLMAASICSSKMRHADLRQFLDTTFIEPHPVPREIHELIVKLGPNAFITTNYDRLIDDAFQKWHDGLVLMPVNNDQIIEQASILKHGSSRFIFTPHGRAEHAATVVLSREDYRKLQYASNSVIQTMTHFFLSRPIIYVGFGLRDPDFLMIKDQISSTFHGAEREHFAIVANASAMSKQYWHDSFGLTLVSYETVQQEVRDSSGKLTIIHRHDHLEEWVGSSRVQNPHPNFAEDAKLGWGTLR